jgi:hypothetical protein
MKRVTGIGIAVVAVLLNAGMLGAYAVSAQTPPDIGSGAPMTGTLTGSRAGTFAYFAVNYPGGFVVGKIELTFTPADPVTLLGTGFNVYGPNGTLEGTGSMVPTNNGTAVFDFYVSTSQAVSLLIQVFNYIQDDTISYTIAATGFTSPVAPTPTAAPAPTGPAPTPAPVLAPVIDVSGSLTGDSAGAYAEYRITVVSGMPDAVITLNYAPDNPVISPGVGLNVYGPTGMHQAADGTGIPGQRTVTLPASMPGTYLLQVFNYIPGLTIDYSLSGGQ